MTEILGFWNPCSLFGDILPYPPNSKFPPKCTKSHSTISYQFTGTRTLPYCYSASIYHRHFLNNCGLLGTSRDPYQFLFRTDKGREEKAGPRHSTSLPPFPGRHLCPQWSRSKNCYSLCSPLPSRLDPGGLTVWRKKEGGRGRDGRQEGITDKNKAPAKSGSSWSTQPRGAEFQQHEKRARRRITGTSFPCGVVPS